MAKLGRYAESHCLFKLLQRFVLGFVFFFYFLSASNSIRKVQDCCAADEGTILLFFETSSYLLQTVAPAAEVAVAKVFIIFIIFFILFIYFFIFLQAVNAKFCVSKDEDDGTSQEIIITSK